MKNKKINAGIIAGLFVILFLGATLCEVLTDKKIISDRIHLFIWYALVTYFCYHSIWGSLPEKSFKAAKSKISFEKHKKMWKRFAIFFYTVCTIAFVVGLFTVVFAPNK